MADTGTIDIARIERDLTEMWKGEEDEGGPEGSPVIRACSFNLIVLLPDEQARREIGPILDQLTLVHPGRTFLVGADGRETTRSLDASVSARCSIPLPGEKQVCCEQIELTFPRGEINRVLSIITSLLVSDVPVVSFIPDPDVIPPDLLNDIIGISDHLVTDGAVIRKCVRRLARLLQAHEGADTTSFGDLSWERIARWRSAIADAFDGNDSEAFLRGLSELRIRTSGRKDHADALLLLGWISDSLGIRLTGKSDVGSEMLWRSSTRSALLRIERTGEAENEGGIISVTFVSGGGRKTVLSAQRETRSLVTEEYQGEKLLRRQTASAPKEMKAECLIRQMNLLETDPLYRKSFHSIFQEKV